MKKWLLFLFIICLVAGGCGTKHPSRNTTAMTDSTKQTAENPVSQPADTELVVSEGEVGKGNYQGGISHGFAGEKLTDEVGAYRLYEGGEVHLPYSISTQGMWDYGVGILLFVDGYPQPYKTNEEDTYAYMHTFHPNAKGYAADELIFTPAVGQAGDTVEIYTVNINDPDFFAGRSDFGFAHTGGSIAAGTRLKYQDTPDDPRVLNGSVCASSFSRECIESMSGTSSGSSGTELQSGVKWRFLLNGKNGGLINIESGENLDVRFEIQGNSDETFGLVLYLNHEPVMIDGSPVIEIDIQKEKETVVSLGITTENLHDHAVFYAILVPRNYFAADSENNCYVQTTSTYYINMNAPEQ